MKVVLREAWGTLVPGRDVRQGPLPPLMLVLTVVTGLVDAFSYLALGHVFVANMTGNVVFMAFAFLGTPGFSVSASAVALAAFLVGSLAGGRIALRTRRHRGKLLYTAMAVQVVLVLVAYAVAQSADRPSSGGVRYALIVLLGLAMGVQNAAARAVAVPDLTTTVLTLTLVGVVADSPLASGKGSRLGRRGLSVVLMFAGALAGGALLLHVAVASPLLAVAALLLISLAVAYSLPRSTGEWVDPA